MMNAFTNVLLTPTLAKQPLLEQNYSKEDIMLCQSVKTFIINKRLLLYLKLKYRQYEANIQTNIDE